MQQKQSEEGCLQQYRPHLKKQEKSQINQYTKQKKKNIQNLKSSKEGNDKDQRGKKYRLKKKSVKATSGFFK